MLKFLFYYSIYIIVSKLFVLDLKMSRYVGSKTPVSILNEYFVSQQIVPRFDLIEQITGHNPKFTYRVSAGGDFAEGSGSSKQQAKHVSAQLLLDMLREKNSNIEILNHAVNNLSIPQDNLIGFNAVGDLTYYCMEKKYPDAVYDLVSDEGPPHARVFTCKCTVSNLSELGNARTKKQAKHHAAFAMLGRLKQLFNEEHNPIVKLNFDKPKIAEPEVTKKRDDEATAYYMQHCKRDSRRFGLTPVYIADQYRSYAKLMDKSETLAALAKNPDFLMIPDVLDTIADELGEELRITTEFGDNTELVFVGMNTTPKLMIAGRTVDQAKLAALNTLFSML